MNFEFLFCTGLESSVYVIVEGFRPAVPAVTDKLPEDCYLGEGPEWDYAYFEARGKGKTIKLPDEIFEKYDGHDMCVRIQQEALEYGESNNY